MACKASKDAHGTTYHVPADPTGKTAGGKQFKGTTEVLVWWQRDRKDPRDETILIRQETPGQKKADVIEITLGQAYALLHALGHAVLRA